MTKQEVAQLVSEIVASNNSDLVAFQVLTIIIAAVGALGTIAIAWYRFGQIQQMASGTNADLKQHKSDTDKHIGAIYEKISESHDRFATQQSVKEMMDERRRAEERIQSSLDRIVDMLLKKE